ncbi:MAG: hypothetical protein IPH75_08325 [bacterium]|nr:hypothetical protein [bacterium]
MLYLFNSAFRPLYLTNVHNTLFLPSGWTNDYRYKIGEQVSEDIKDTLKRQDDLLIVYIDRFAIDGYRFYPLRKGRFLSIRTELDRFFFRVVLEDYVFPVDITDFQTTIRNRLIEKGMPQLQGSDPKSTKDGQYAIVDTEAILNQGKYYSSETAWTKAVEALFQTQAFKDLSTSSNANLFAKASLSRRSTPKKELSPKIKSDTALFVLHQNEQYDFKLNYVYPIQQADQTKMAKIEVVGDDTVRCLGSSALIVDSYSNSVSYGFTLKRHLEETKGSLSLRYSTGISEAKETGTVVGPDRPIVFEIKNKAWFWFWICLLILCYTTSTFVVGTDWSEVWPLSITSIFVLYYPKLAAVAVQTLALVLLFKMLGKKII